MPKSNVKYEIASQEADTPDFLLQHTTEFKNPSRKRLPFWWGILQTSLLILLYFILSIGLTFYQQWILTSISNYPLAVVVCHLFVKLLLSSLVRCVLECHSGQRRVRLSFQSMILSVALPGIASGLDIGFSNWAIKLLSMSLFTMTKSTTIVFILGFALLFRLEKKSWSLMGTVVMIAGGLAMFTYKSTELNVAGFCLALLASLSSGLRWTMAQLIMQKSKLGLGNPIDMMYHMQPWMLLAITPVAIWFEGSDIYNDTLNINWSDIRTLITVIAVLGGAFIAFFMELAEFMVVTHTSSLTLSVSGIFKEICTLVLAFEKEGNHMSGLNFAGLLMCLGGIIVHAIQKLVVAEKNKAEDLELDFNSVTNNGTKVDDGFDTNLPLLTTQKSTSLTNLLNENFSSDEDEGKNEENSSQVLFNILQRREQ